MAKITTDLHTDNSREPTLDGRLAGAPARFPVQSRAGVALLRRGT